MKIAIRIILGLVMIWFIYGETGPVTAIFATLMLVLSELLNITLNNMNDNQQMIVNNQARILQIFGERNV